MSNGFDFDELTAFQEDLVQMASQEFPKAAKRFMKNEARTLARRMKKEADAKVKRGRDGVYHNRFKAGKKVYKWPDSDFNIRVFNDAPHAHLVEYGHRMVGHKPNSVEGDFVPGNHLMENTAIAYESEFAEHTGNKLAEQIMKELEK